MAGINHPPWNLAAVILLCFYIFSPSEAASPRGKGFSLKLIHADSPESLFYHGNLTDSLSSERLLSSSISRVRYLNSANTSTTATATTTTTTIRPPLIPKTYIFLVEVSIGTGGGLRTFHLALDTGSSLTWTKCVEVLPSTLVDEFDPHKSPTYGRALPNDSLCQGNCKPSDDGKRCDCIINYVDGTTVKGELARDTFTFKTAGGSQEATLAFGCIDQRAGHGRSLQGIMGMGAHEESMVVQLDPYTDRRFSYCLIPIWNPVRYGFLRFGNDIVMKEPFQKTPIPDSGKYYLTVKAVSLGLNRLSIPPDVFERKGQTGGIIIDSGASISHLTSEAFEPIKKAMVQYLDSQRFTSVGEKNREGVKLEVCYALKPDFKATALPSMTFHFAGIDASGATADFEIKSEHVFKRFPNDKFFCWFMARITGSSSIIGAYQQSNTRFTYDLKKKQLQFAPEDCARDATRP